MSEPSIFGEDGRAAKPASGSQEKHGRRNCPAHGLFGARLGTPRSVDPSRLYGRVQSSSKASLTDRT